MKSKRVLRESDEKIIDIRNKSLKRKKHRRIAFGLILLLIAVILTLLLTPYFNIKYIDVSGQSKVTQKELFEASKISYGENIFKLNVKKVKKNISEIPYVDDIKVKRKLPNIVIFEVTERTPATALPAGEGFVLMDLDGRFLETTNNTNLPVVEGLSPQIEAGKFIGDEFPVFTENLKKLYRLLEENNLKDRVTSYKVDEYEDVTFVIDGTKTIILGEEDNIEYKFKMLEAAVNELPPTQKGTINLSEEGKALYSPEE